MRNTDNRKDCRDRKPPLSSREKALRFVETSPEDGRVDRGERIVSGKFLRAAEAPGMYPVRLRIPEAEGVSKN